MGQNRKARGKTIGNQRARTTDSWASHGQTMHQRLNPMCVPPVTHTRPKGYHYKHMGDPWATRGTALYDPWTTHTRPMGQHNKLRGDPYDKRMDGIYMCVAYVPAL